MGETSNRSSVLVVDDEKLLRWSVCQALSARGHEAREASDAGTVLATAGSADAVVLDYRLPGADGLDLLERIVGGAPSVPVVMTTAFGGVRLAVEAMRLGAYDFVPKPFDVEIMCEVVEGALQATAPPFPELEAPIAGLVARSAPMRELSRWIGLAAAVDTTALLIGESGTGKNVIARAVHAAGPRSAGPFVHIACSAMSETLVDSELFGHEPGAFTGATHRHVGLLEQGEGGTVFLDEVTELSPAVQAKLLRFLQDGTVRRVGSTQEIAPDVRVIAASQTPLDVAVSEGRFREDLYYRLRVLEAQVPPLRERAADIPALVEAVLGNLDRERVRMAPAAMRALASHAWPGNVRQLRNVIERAVVLAGDRRVLRVSDLGLNDVHAEGATPYVLPASGLDLAAFEREMLRQALVRTGRNRTKAAELLGLTRDAVRYRIAKYDGEP